MDNDRVKEFMKLQDRREVHCGPRQAREHRGQVVKGGKPSAPPKGGHVH